MAWAREAWPAPAPCRLARVGFPKGELVGAAES